MATIKDYELDSDVEIGSREIKGVVSEDAVDEGGEVDSYIGYTIFYTIGEEFMVEREWLLERMDQLGLPVWRPDAGPESDTPKEYMAPPKVTGKRAFNRVRKYLLTHANDETVVMDTKRVPGEDEEIERKIQFVVEKINTDEFHLKAKAYFYPDELDDDHGDWRTEKLGVFWYDHDEDGNPMINWDRKINPNAVMGDEMMGFWSEFKERAERQFEKHRTHHIGKDIQKMLYKYTHYWTSSVKVREGGAAYFVPSKHKESLDALKTLIDDLNEYKLRGHECRLKRITTVDAAEERAMVEERARKEAKEVAKDALGEAIEDYEEQLQADDEVLVDDIIDELRDDLMDSMDFASEYSQLLDTEIAIQEIVDDWKRQRNLKGEKEHIVERALEEAEAGEEHTAESAAAPDTN